MEHFNYYENILIQWTGLVSYTIASIRFRNFVSLYRTDSFYVPLVSVCALFDFNYSCVAHEGVPLIPFLIRP